MSHTAAGNAQAYAHRAVREEMTEAGRCHEQEHQRQKDNCPGGFGPAIQTPAQCGKSVPVRQGWRDNHRDEESQVRESGHLPAGYFFVQAPPIGLMNWPAGVLAISCAPVACPAASGETPDLVAVWV